MKILIINGPNLNLLGKREKLIYGDISFDQYFNDLVKLFPDFNLEYFHSNIEGELIDKLQVSDEKFEFILLNAGGYSHTSIALSDCISAINTDVIEIHISNIYSREEYRRNSLISKNCKAVVCGFGIHSYKAALSVLEDLT
tara:strand:- start:5539 stop:5961 length:423 start_codon:yes stop_codon:yes gene_type:complete